MCFNKYKSIIKGAFALVISYLNVVGADENSRRKSIEMVTEYLADNGVCLDLVDSALLPIKIVRAGYEVVAKNRSMEQALIILSVSTKLNLDVA